MSSRQSVQLRPHNGPGAHSPNSIATLLKSVHAEPTAEKALIIWINHFINAFLSGNNNTSSCKVHVILVQGCSGFRNGASADRNGIIDSAASSRVDPDILSELDRDIHDPVLIISSKCRLLIIPVACYGPTPTGYLVLQDLSSTDLQFFQSLSQTKFEQTQSVSTFQPTDVLDTWTGILSFILFDVIREAECHEKKIRLEELEAIRTDFQILLDMFPGIVCINRGYGHIDFMNKYGLDFFQETSETLKDFIYVEQFHPDSRKHGYDLWDKFIVEKQEKLEGTFLVQRKSDGAYRWLSHSVHPIHEENKYYGVIIDLTDITNAKEQAVEGQRLLQAIVNHIPGIVW